jgi:hypothetical protein
MINDELREEEIMNTLGERILNENFDKDSRQILSKDMAGLKLQIENSNYDEKETSAFKSQIKTNLQDIEGLKDQLEMNLTVPKGEVEEEEKSESMYRQFFDVAFDEKIVTSRKESCSERQEEEIEEGSKAGDADSEGGEDSSIEGYSGRNNRNPQYYDYQANEKVVGISVVDSKENFMLNEGYNFKKGSFEE